MNKKIIIIIFMVYILATICFADTITLKNGEVIVGEITELKDNFLKVTTYYGEVTINKENVKSIISEDQEVPSNSNNLNFNYTKPAKNEMYLKGLTDSYKTLKNAGTGFLIPGLILTLTPILVATPLIVISGLEFYSYHTYYKYQYYEDYEDDEYYDYYYYYDPTVEFSIGLSVYVTSISIGLILDIISIACFAKAAQKYKEWEQAVSVYVGARNNEPALGITYKF